MAPVEGRNSNSTEPEKQLLVNRDRGRSEYFFDQGRRDRLPGVSGI